MGKRSLVIYWTRVRLEVAGSSVPACSIRANSFLLSTLISLGLFSLAVSYGAKKFQVNLFLSELKKKERDLKGKGT